MNKFGGQRGTRAIIERGDYGAPEKYYSTTENDFTAGDELNKERRERDSELANEERERKLSLESEHQDNTITVLLRRANDMILKRGGPRTDDTYEIFQEHVGKGRKPAQGNSCKL